MNTYLRLLKYLKPYAWKLALAMVFMGLLAITTGIYAWLIGPLIEFITKGGTLGESTIAKVMAWILPLSSDRNALMLQLPLFLILVTALKGIAYAGQFYLMGDIGQRVIFDMRRDLHEKLLSQSLDFFHDRKSGDILSRFINDVRNVENAVTYAVSSALRDTATVLVLLVTLFFMDWKLSLMAFIILPIAAFPLSRFAKYLKKVTMDAQVSQGDMAGLLSETVQGTQIVQAFCMEGYEKERFGRENRRYLGIMLKSFFVRAVQSPAMEMLGVIGLAITIWYATHRIQTGDLKPAHFFSFFATVIMIYMPIKNLGKLNQFYQAGVVGAERVFEYIDAVPRIIDKPGALDLQIFQSSVKYEDIRFKYRDIEVIKGVDLEIPRGKTVALIGESGAGKSTLASLLPRFYDVTGGRITVDGNDIRDLTILSLRSKIALVTQDVFLFNDTVRENISYGNQEITPGSVERAARAAYAHDFIMAMPEGYETLIGERGIKLSGGQKQRLAIARALLKDSPILILDEATSALDSEGEAEVQKALDALMQNRTTLVIAHRLSTIRNADELIVLKNGTVVERGRHQELLDADGEYAKLHRLQFRD
jgi:subfamily B ATP-binding cassette protein MsbA